MPFILSSELCSRIKALYRKTWYLKNPFQKKNNVSTLPVLHLMRHFITADYSGLSLIFFFILYLFFVLNILISSRGGGGGGGGETSSNQKFTKK